MNVRRLSGTVASSLGLVLTLALVIAPQMVWAQAQGQGRIQKCQDAEGRWHYGSNVHELCGEDLRQHSVLSPSGVVLDAYEPDSSEGNRRARDVYESSPVLQLEDKRWLLRYTGEEAILGERDRKLAELESAMETAQSIQSNLLRDIERLETNIEREGAARAIDERERSIAAYAQEIQHLQAEQQWVREDYQQRLDRYRQAATRAGLY